MQFDRTKLKTVILYTCTKCDAGQLGAVKLHKVLYYSDMMRYVHVGTPLTGATYRKRPHGPTCDQLLPSLRELQRDSAIEIRETDYFGYRKKEYVPRQQPDVDRLSEVEREILDEVIDFVCFNNTAKTISEYSHNLAWDMVEFGDVLPYNSAYLMFPNEVSPEAMEWANQEAAKLEAAGATKREVGGTTFADFRSRLLEASGHQ